MQRAEFILEDIHEQDVVRLPAQDARLAAQADLTETDPAVAGDAALVKSENAEHDAVKVLQVEGIIQEQQHGFLPVPLVPAAFVANGDAQHGGAVDAVHPEERAAPD